MSTPSRYVLTDEEITAAWNGAGADRPDAGSPDLYLHYMRAVAKAQLDKVASEREDVPNDPKERARLYLLGLAMNRLQRRALALHDNWSDEVARAMVIDICSGKL